MPDTPKPRFFASAAAFGDWLAAHHATADEAVVGYHKVGTGKPSLTWSGSVDEALRFGWIDGVRKRIDEDRYQIRFTPRRPGSTWSAVNIRKAEALIAAGRMHPAGLRAFAARDEARSRRYSYEQRKTAALAVAEQRRFQAKPKAWAFFQAQPPGYRRTATHWVVQARRPETRQRRLEQLIARSARGERIPQTDYDAWKRRAQAQARRGA